MNEIGARLSPAEHATVQLLFAHPGVPFSKEALCTGLQRLGRSVEPCMVDVYVRRARAKLTAAGSTRTIETIWGRGYMASESDDSDPAGPPPNTTGLNALLVCA